MRASQEWKEVIGLLSAIARKVQHEEGARGAWKWVTGYMNYSRVSVHHHRYVYSSIMGIWLLA